MANTYKVYRDGALIAQPTVSNYADMNVTNGVTYGYQVSAVNSVGEGPKSNVVYSTPFGAPPPPPPPSPSTIYGSAINIDSTSKLILGSTNHGKVSHRFKAKSNTTVTSVQFSQRGGPTYSGGTGGTCRVSIQGDNSGVPNGTIIGTTGTITPGNSGSWTTYAAVTVSAPISNGNIYHVVFENIDSDPVTNYFSINEAFVYGSTLSPRQPLFVDTDYAVLYAQPSSWSVQGQFTGIMDITCADGNHIGMGYIQNMFDKFATIQGTSLCREHFTVSGGDRTVGSLYVRVRRTSGSGSLIINVKQSSTILRTVTVPASSVTPPSAAGGDNGGSQWVGGSFSALTLSDGTTYDVELSTAPDTQYTAAPIRKGSSTATSGSPFNSILYFNDGTGQFSTNNGSSWTDIYTTDSPDPDIQFYFAPYVSTGVTAPSWWVAPVTSGTVNLTGLDTTGATDMLSAIQAQIDAAPDNRIIQFPAGTLKISSAINYHGRHNLIFDGTGCTINNVANANTGDSNLKCTFFTRFSETAATHITIRNFHIQAASPSPGVFQSGEFAAALGAQKGSYIEFYNNTCTGLFGDMVTLNENPDHVWIHENNVVNCGRHMLSVICADTVMCESNTMGVSGYGVFDIEQEPGSVAGALSITFRNNIITSYGINTFVSINGVNSDHPTHDIVITGNTVTGKALRMYSIYATVNRVQRLTFSNNTSHSSMSGPIFNFDYIDTLVVQNNDQTHTGTLIFIGSHCTGVTVNGNTPP